MKDMHGKEISVKRALPLAAMTPGYSILENTKVTTPYGTGFVVRVNADQCEVMLDGGGTYICTDSQFIEVVT